MIHIKKIKISKKNLKVKPKVTLGAFILYEMSSTK